MGAQVPGAFLAAGAVALQRLAGPVMQDRLQLLAVVEADGRVQAPVVLVRAVDIHHMPASGRERRLARRGAQVRDGELEVVAHHGHHLVGSLKSASSTARWPCPPSGVSWYRPSGRRRTPPIGTSWSSSEVTNAVWSWPRLSRSRSATATGPLACHSLSSHGGVTPGRLTSPPSRNA